MGIGYFMLLIPFILVSLTFERYTISEVIGEKRESVGDAGKKRRTQKKGRNREQGHEKLQKKKTREIYS